MCQCEHCLRWPDVSDKVRVYRIAKKVFPYAEIEVMGRAWFSLPKQDKDAIVTKLVLLEQNMPHHPHNWWLKQRGLVKEVLRPLVQAYLDKITWFTTPADMMIDKEMR